MAVGRPDFHARSIPAKYLLISLEESRIGRKRDSPHIEEIAIFGRYFVLQGYIFQRAGGIRLQVAKVAPQAHPDLPLVVHSEPSGNRHRDRNAARRRAVVLPDIPAGHSHVHEPITVPEEG